MKIFVTLPDGATHEVAGKSGSLIMESIRAAGLPIRSECGGAMACATCHVALDQAWVDRVGEADGDESDLLDMSSYRQPNSRLACQIQVNDALDGLKISLQLDAYDW